MSEQSDTSRKLDAADAAMKAGSGNEPAGDWWTQEWARRQAAKDAPQANTAHNTGPSFAVAPQPAPAVKTLAAPQPAPETAIPQQPAAQPSPAEPQANPARPAAQGEPKGADVAGTLSSLKAGAAVGLALKVAGAASQQLTGASTQGVEPDNMSGLVASIRSMSRSKPGVF